MNGANVNSFWIALFLATLEIEQMERQSCAEWIVHGEVLVNAYSITWPAQPAHRTISGFQIFDSTGKPVSALAELKGGPHTFKPGAVVRFERGALTIEVRP